VHENSIIATHLQDRIDVIGGSQPLVHLLPVARDSVEQCTCLKLDVFLIDKQLLHPPAPLHRRVHKEVSHAHRGSQGIVLGFLCTCVRKSVLYYFVRSLE
jgi:hypothetical protein